MLPCCIKMEIYWECYTINYSDQLIKINTLLNTYRAVGFVLLFIVKAST